MFTPGEPIWSSRWLRGLRERFLDNPDTSKRKFLEKLRDQLDPTTPAQVHQLMAEALYFHRLIVSTRDGSAKRQDIETVLGWSSAPVAIPEELIQGLTPGIANPGQYFHVKRPNQIGFLVEFVELWKELGDDEQARLMEDAWAFKSFAMEREFRSKTLTGEPNSYRTQREALLHLVFPDVFEAIVSTNHKHWVAGKAWAAALQATNALVLAHTGIEPKPDDDRDTTRQMLRLRRESLELEDMVARYSSISAYLFGLIVSDGVLDPIDDTIREIPDKGMYGVSYRSPPSFFRRRNVTPVKTGAGIQKHFWPVTFSFPVGSWIPASAGTTGRGTFS